MLAGLTMKEKRIGLISHSEKEGMDYQDQPVIKLLKGFGILKYFNEMIVIAKELPKSMFIPNEKRILFVDDDVENLFDVVENTEADGALPENIVYNPKSIEESVEKTGTVLVKDLLKYEEDFMPLYVMAEPEQTFFKRKDETYWEEKERDILDQFWYSSDNIKQEDFQIFLEEMKNNGIGSDSVLETIQNESVGPMFSSGINVMIKLTDSGRKKITANSFIEAGRPRIKSKEIPKKPNGKKKYELDHKKPRWKGGKDTKDNLHWVEKDKHKEKTKNEGSYEYGGVDRHKKLKSKGKENYTEYQRNTGKAKVQKEREEIGEKAFSEKQRERAKKRWKKSNNDNWYKISEIEALSNFQQFVKESNIGQNTDSEGVRIFGSIFNLLNKTYGIDKAIEIFQLLAKKEGEKADLIREEIKKMPNSEYLLIKFKEYMKLEIIKPLYDYMKKLIEENPVELEVAAIEEITSNLFQRVDGFLEHKKPL
jgi:hypothetical protein